ncbi:MAG: hypothetical protein HQM08_02630 [Candidatus Riflebacteria bacterium]|nr:hypothetical protein [Candidatus Riflebacteria bacterium]
MSFIEQLPSKLSVCVFQMDVKKDSVNENLSEFKRLCSESMKFNPNIIIAPEMWSRSFCGEKLIEEACAFEERIAFCGDLARENKMWIVAGSLPEKTADGKVYNTLPIISPTGEMVYKFRKMHMFINSSEPKYFIPGEEIPQPLSSGPWKIGAGICFDLRFPEVFRRQVFEGANFFVVCAQFPDPRLEHFTLLVRARALENQAYLVAANRCGVESPLTFSGGSTVISPNGNSLGSLDEREGILHCDLEFNALDEYRKKSPFLGLSEKLKQ